jgi:pSer/pThr/pTyr-binding forkhead associated (FHA) protein
MAWITLPDGQKFPLTGISARIGRDDLAELTLLGDSKVSRVHAELRLLKDQWIITDLGSRNGTMVNKQRIEEHPLKNGDIIQVGNTIVRFEASEDPNATEAGTGALGSVPELSEREIQVLALIASGLTDREIGERLFVSASTVRSHLDRIGVKTGLRRRAELTRLAVDLGIVT